MKVTILNIINNSYINQYDLISNTKIYMLYY